MTLYSPNLTGGEIIMAQDMFDDGLLKDNIIYIDSSEGNRGKYFEQYIQNNTSKSKDPNFKKQMKITTKHYLYYDDIVHTDLPVGDYAFNGLIEEYKTVTDLRHSMDGRLNRQIDNFLVNYSEKGYRFRIIVEDNCSITFSDTNFFNEQYLKGIGFNNFHSQQECLKGILITWATSQNISRLYSLNKSYKTNGYIHTLSLFAGHNLTTKIAKAIPGIRISDVQNLTTDDLKSVNGIGSKKATEIIKKRDVMF